MPETKLIPTLTQLITNGSNISIKSEYFDTSTLPDTIEARITDNIGSQDGVSYGIGELIIKEKNYPDHLSYFIDSNGNLILSVNTGDVLNYSIDPISGDLIYTINS